MELIAIGLAFVIGIAFGFIFGASADENTPKTKEYKRLDEIPDRQLIALFMAVGGELESRGLARRTDKNPFEDLDK